MHEERVYAAVDLSNIRHNIAEIYRHTKGCSRIMAVIKADGYGHGAKRIAEALLNADEVFGFAVATIDEALELSAMPVKKPVLILGYCFPSGYREAVENDIRLTIFDRKSAEQLNAAAAGLDKKAKIHIKLDTGMGRIGIKPDSEGRELVRDIAGLENIEIEGIFTHFARADEADKSYANKQLQVFKDFVESLRDFGIEIPYPHCANSAAIMEMPDTWFKLVRSGIITYGMMPSDEVKAGDLNLKPAMEIRSSVIFVKDVPAGTAISYGGTFVTNAPSRIATVSVGYADGYPRSLSGKGEVLIRGHRYRVAGRVCMDQMMVDITGNTDIEAGDPVTIVGRDGDDEISMEEFAAMSGRINYEAVCDIGKRVPRVYLT